MKQQMAKLSEAMEKGTGAQITQAPKLSIDPFVADDELWKDYLKRFETAVKASNLPASLKASTFLSKQSHSVYKELDVYATQMATPKTADDLKFDEITKYMEKQYNPKRYVIRERNNFWTEIKRRPGETPRELATRIRKAADKCSFHTITQPLEEARIVIVRVRFSINHI